MLETKTVTNGPIAKQLQRVCHDTLDFVSVPGFPSAIRVFALTHSRRNVEALPQPLPWPISISLGPSHEASSRHHPYCCCSACGSPWTHDRTWRARQGAAANVEH